MVARLRRWWRVLIEGFDGFLDEHRRLTTAPDLPADPGRARCDGSLLPVLSGRVVRAGRVGCLDCGRWVPVEARPGGGPGVLADHTRSVA